MEIADEKENVKLKTESPVYVSGQLSRQRDLPDAYPEPDSAHTSRWLQDLDRESGEKSVERLGTENQGSQSRWLQDLDSSSRESGEKSVVRLQPRHGTENQGSQSRWLQDLDSSSRESGEKSVVRLGTENQGSQSGETSSASLRDRQTSNASQVSIKSSELTSAPPVVATATASHSTSAQSNSEPDSAAEMADVVGDTMRKPFPRQPGTSQRRPGVILLGRGNSFSLGRSEVIFLHNTKPYRWPKVQNSTAGAGNNHDTDLCSSAACNGDRNSGVISSQISTASTSIAELGGPSPPTLSNEMCFPSGSVLVDTANHDTNWPIALRSDKTKAGTIGGRMSGGNAPTDHETSPGFEEQSRDKLAELWARAEGIMAGKKRAVLDVLAQFGVGESGEDTQQEEEEEVEESVWQVVEDKAHAVDR